MMTLNERIRKLEQARFWSPLTSVFLFMFTKKRVYKSCVLLQLLVNKHNPIPCQVTTNRVVVLWCKHRTHLNDDAYWLGLDIQLSPEWYDGNPSTYRNWAQGEPDEDDNRCIVYKSNGEFKDQSCSSEKRFTCQTPAGILPVSVFYLFLSCTLYNSFYTPSQPQTYIIPDTIRPIYFLSDREESQA